MPELPEVETMVRGIRPYVEGRKLTRMERCRTKCRPITLTPAFPTLARRVQGRTVTQVRRWGKRVAFEFDTGATLTIEPRMTGLVLLADPPDPGHLRLKFEFEGNRDYNTVWFWDRRGLGTIRLYGPGELERHLLKSRLGTDALTFTPNDWKRCCGRTARAIKVVLLDQKAVAGIGNLYASEILHHAGIHPGRAADSLRAGELRKLHAATMAILEEAIRYEGSTLGDGTYRNALNKAGSYQNVHRVYQKHGQSCPRCPRGIIKRILQAQRSTFFCPCCQR